MDKKKIIQIIDTYGIGIIFLLLIALFTFLTQGTIISLGNVLNVMTNIVPIGLIAMGVTIVIITTGIDLSSGSIVATSTVFTAILAQTASAQSKILDIPQLPFFIPLLVGILVGVLAGFINGLVIVKTKIPPFIATLGMMTAARGLALLPTKGNTIGDINPAITFLGQGKIFGIPTPILIFILMIIVSHYLLSHD